MNVILFTVFHGEAHAPKCKDPVAWAKTQLEPMAMLVVSDDESGETNAGFEFYPRMNGVAVFYARAELGLIQPHVLEHRYIDALHKACGCTPIKR